MAKKPARNYTAAGVARSKIFAAPALPYLPQDPARYNPPIGLIGCGGITTKHLAAYKAAGYNVVALCNRTIAKARARQREFFPQAAVYSDYRDLLKRDDIEVVDITTHPTERVGLIKAAIAARKHILSQKPFVTDLGVGQKLVDLADSRGVKLAVNQNGRWAPHFAWMRKAIAANLIGQPNSAHLSVHWDHNWIKGTPFESIRHILLYDFAIHWFDILTCFMGSQTPRRVFSSTAVSPSQRPKPALLGQVLIEYDHAQASLVFDADVRFGPDARSYISGTSGTLIARGPSITEQNVTLHTAKGIATPKLRGEWFTNGFHGTMAELLLAIEQRREPSHSARDNLRSLALCFAACASADRKRPVVPGSVRKLPQ